MECPTCGSDMIWQCDYDLGEELTQSDFEGPNEEVCGTSISVYIKTK
jgi:hypothetical protein